ncbi:MAG: glycosyltransferase family 4 protein, partial [Saprospiraceae bacterium]|nr:glycosyltransferase family 4 protein [Saprospiraceae bacterium]
MAKTKILILADPLDSQNAGIKRAIEGILHALGDQGSELHIIVLRQKNEPIPNLKVITYPRIFNSTGFRFFKYFLYNPYIARKLNVDVVFEPAHFGPFLLPAKMNRVTMIHDITPIKFPELHRSFSAFIQRCFLGSILKKADVIFTNSAHTTKDIQDTYNIPTEKTTTIPLGVGKSIQLTTDSSWLKSNGITTPYLLSVGTIEPRKNYTQLIEIFNQLKPVQKELKLVIVGKWGWRYHDTTKALNSSPYRDDILVLDSVNDEQLSALYTQCALFIMTSIYEGFGLPVVEAVKCGAQCLLPYHSSLKEFNSQNIEFYKDESPQEIAQIILDQYFNTPKENKHGLPDQNLLSIYNFGHSAQV